MLLGKRTRPPMKRTTSMTEFTLDLNNMVLDQQQPLDHLKAATSASSPRNHRRNSSDFIETTHFLKSCFLCKRRLIPGRDIYMYRGDSAFCSLECRQQQMTQDERKEKYSQTSKNKAVAISGGAVVVSGQGETVAAAV